MIKSPYSLTDLDRMAETFFKDIDHQLELTRHLRRQPNDDFKPVMDHLLANLRTIITGRPDALERNSITIDQLIDDAVNRYLANNHPIPNKKNNVVRTVKEQRAYVTNLIREKIAQIFDYQTGTSSFTKKDKGMVAYRHAKRFMANTCPYCNANFTLTIRNKRMKSRPQFDHFLKKSRYPYFGLSFFNLIPCCAHCNSGGLKGGKIFSITTHLHPFVDDMENKFQFRTDVDAVDFLVNDQDFTLKLRPCKGVNKQMQKKAEANIKAFGLQDRYSHHKDIAADILKKAYTYNNQAVENLYSGLVINGNPIFTSPAEIKELVMGNFLHPENFHKRILSKLTRDIAKEFGITI